MVNCNLCNKRMLFFQKNYFEDDKTKVYCKECKEKIEQKLLEKEEKKNKTELEKNTKLLIKQGYKKVNGAILWTDNSKFLAKLKDKLINLPIEKGSFSKLKIDDYKIELEYPNSFNPFMESIPQTDIKFRGYLRVIYIKPVFNKIFFSADTKIEFNKEFPYRNLKDAWESVLKSRNSLIPYDTGDSFDWEFINKFVRIKKIEKLKDLRNKKYVVDPTKINGKVSLYIKNYGCDTIVTTRDPDTGEFKRQHNILDYFFILNNCYLIIREIWVAHRHIKFVLPKFDKIVEESVIEIKDKNISSSILDQLFGFLKNIPIEEKEMVLDRGSSYIPEKIKFEIKKKYPLNSKNINENTLIKYYVPDLGITNIFVNNTNISVPYLCCDINEVKSKPVLRKQRAIGDFERLKSVVDLIGKVSYYEDKDEIIYFNEEFYFILDKKTSKPKFK